MTEQEKAALERLLFKHIIFSSMPFIKYLQHSFFPIPLRGTEFYPSFYCENDT